jgi:transducin (beta)-like 1
VRRAGFRHAAFTFGCESQVAKSNINGAKIPPGQLINFVQKGIMYTELERSVAEDWTDAGSTEPFQLLRPEGQGSPDGPPPAKKAKLDPADDAPAPAPAANGSSSLVAAEQVTLLSGHTSEVFVCAWSPRTMQLASGSGDSTARIWRVPGGACGKAQSKAIAEPAILNHLTDAKEKAKDVTVLDWNHDGSQLATGAYDGKARIWTADGKLLATLSKHTGPIFSLKWNASGRYLLSGSVDSTCVIWDAAKGEMLQHFRFHKEPTLDVDWRDEDSFASCSTDKTIYVCKLHQQSWLQRFQGHSDEVNAIKWDPAGQVLASCSDDKTAKLWSMSQAGCVRDLTEHTKEIYTIKWSPTGPSSANTDAKLVLASASFDATIRLWDAKTGACLHVLSKHTEPVYSVAFSANGRYLASGSFDRSLHIWDVKDGSLIQTYHGDSGIFEVCWNSDGSKVAACFSNSAVAILDLHT